MPPKRRLNMGSGSEESNMESKRRSNVTALIPEAMQNIEKLKAKRDRDRREISKSFDAHIAGEKKGIENHYASKAKQKSAEAKDLLARYAEALEQRASIEKSIEEVVLNAREDLKELTIMLEAAYSGRYEQTRAAVGLFASVAPVTAKGVATANIPGSATDKSAGKEGRTLAGDSVYARDSAGQYEKERPENFLDQISW
ncbi:hypothetical protein HD806DRAFT_496390 [Xylariaceae sp. AK1471]|nr:hypothetical protein HD806DRAFT_496390 [Xylariaceae sp. AK1471]